jgi:putative ABC transport system permease protein
MVFLRNVLRAPARSTMTVLGVAAGVALFVAISAITIDARRQISSAVSVYQLEVVIYERRANSPFTSRISIPQMRELEARFGSELAPLVLGSHNAAWNSYALIVGVTPAFLNRIPMTAGSRYQDGSGEVIVGEIAAARLGVSPGSAIPLDGRQVRIPGIYRTGSRLLDGGVMMDIASAQRIMTRGGAEPQYTLAVVRAGSEGRMAELIAEVERSFPNLRAIRGTEFAGALRLMRVVDAFVRTIAVIALIGTCVVVSNTFLMAISERTREIGILMAVGWSPWLVLRMLLAECLLICAIGAALGNLLALALLRLVNGMPAVGFGWIPVRFPLSLTGASLVMAVSVSVIALAWPAVVLWRIQPLAALHHE